MAPTVTAPAAAPGEPTVQVPEPELPAATATTMPAADALFTATDVASVPSAQPLVPSDRLMATMLNAVRLATTHSTPAVTFAIEPLPRRSRTLTPTRLAAGATPEFGEATLAAMVPATWVPWPLSS